MKKKINFNKNTEQVVIHNLEKLSQEDYTNRSGELKYYEHMDKLQEFNPKEYEIIQVEYTIKLTNKLNDISQWGNGDWTRCYVVVKENDTSNWRIYDIYGHVC